MRLRVNLYRVCISNYVNRLRGGKPELCYHIMCSHRSTQKLMSALIRGIKHTWRIAYIHSGAIISTWAQACEVWTWEHCTQLCTSPPTCSHSLLHTHTHGWQCQAVVRQYLCSSAPWRAASPESPWAPSLWTAPFSALSSPAAPASPEPAHCQLPLWAGPAHTHTHTETHTNE